MMNCRDCRERLSDLLEDDFASNEAALRGELRSHLETCVDCRRELELLRAVRDELRAFAEISATKVHAPADLRSRVRVQLLQEQPTKSPNTTLGSVFRLPRLTLSGGAVLAACCLLLLVNSGPIQDSLFPNEPNSAPLTTENFHVPSSAFQETLEEKRQREAQEKAVKTKNRVKNPTRRETKPANSSPLPTEAPIVASPTVENPMRLRDSTMDDTRMDGTRTDGTEVNTKTRGENLRGHLNTPRIAKNEGATANIGGKAEAKGTQPTPASTKRANQNNGSERPVKSTPQGVNPGANQDANNDANNAALISRNTRPETSPPGVIPFPAGPQGPTGPQGPAGLAGPAGVNLNSGNSFESAQAKGPLIGAPVPESVIPFTAAPATASAGSALADAGTGARVRANKPNQSIQSASPGLPGMMRVPGGVPGRGALTSKHAVPMALAAPQVDYFFAPNTTQVVNLSFVPEQDAPLAQLRITLPSGLRFGDEVKNQIETESKPKEESKTRAALKSDGQNETSRIVWRGPAPKGTAIENAVELKTVAQGRHKVVLTLEGLDGKPLQVKNVLFQIQESPAPETPRTTPGETK